MGDKKSGEQTASEPVHKKTNEIFPTRQEMEDWAVKLITSIFVVVGTDGFACGLFR